MTATSLFSITTKAAYEIIKKKVSSDMLANLIPTLFASFTSPGGDRVHRTPDDSRRGASIGGSDTISSGDLSTIFAALREALGSGVVAGTLPSTFTGSIAGFEDVEAINRYYSSLVDMLRYPIILKLKTLPMLSLSHAGVLFKRVGVVINTNSGLAPNRRASKSLDPWNRVMSGVYYVVGFKHVFSAKEAYSQFILIREPFDFAAFIFEDYLDGTV